jgi:hypothetical protein
MLAAFNTPHESPIVVQGGITGSLWAANILNGKAECLFDVAVGRRCRFENFKQGRSAIPPQLLTAIDNHVAFER